MGWRNLTDFKQKTEVATAWLTLVGAIVAGSLAFSEYRSHQREVRTQRAVDYLASGDSEEIFNARYKLKNNENAKADKMRALLTDKSVEQYRINQRYYQFVLDELVRHNEEAGQKPEFQRVLGFLERGAICAQERICDEKAVRTSLGYFGKDFIRTYIVYICYLRKLWNDRSIGARVEEFYNPSAVDACDDYYTSLSIADAIEKMPRSAVSRR